MWNSYGNGVLKKMTVMMRQFTTSSRSRAPNLRKINPRVPYQEAACIAEGLYGIIKSHGPLTIGDTWNHAKDTGINGLTSKTHMKLVLKWMRGRSMLKQICNRVGSSKKFLLTTLPSGTQENQPDSSVELNLKSENLSRNKKPKQKHKRSR